MVDNETFTGTGRRALAAWTGAVQRFAVPVVALLLVLTVLAAVYTASNLAINTSTTDMFSADTPFRRNAIEYDKAFPQFKDLIVVVVDAPTPEEAEAAARHLVSGMQSNGAVFARVEWPGGDPFFRRNGLLYRSPDELSELGDLLAQAEPLLATLAQQPNLVGLFDVLTLALKEGSEDEALGRLLSAIHTEQRVLAIAQRTGAFEHSLSWRKIVALNSSHRQIILVKPAIDSTSLSPGKDAIAEIRRIADELDAVRKKRAPVLFESTAAVIQGRVLMRLTGSIALNQEELESAAVGGKTAGVISLLLVTVLMILGLRSFWLILPALLTLIIGLIWTAAFAALSIGHLNLISVAFAVLFVGLGIDFSIHFCLRYREALGETEVAARALTAAAGDVGGSLTIGALCAALGFLAFLPTDYKGLAELGIISAGGMLVALFLNLTLLPALLAFLPIPAPRLPKFRTAGDRPDRPIVLTALALGAIGAVIALQVRFDFNPMNLKDPKSESVIAFHDLANNGRSGVYAIDLLAKDRAKAKMEARRLSALPEVGYVVTIDSMIPGDQAAKLAIIEDIGLFLVPALEPPAAGTKLTLAQRIAAASAFRTFLDSYADQINGNPFANRARSLAESLTNAANNAEVALALERRLTKNLPKVFEDLGLALSAEPITFDDLPNHIRDSWIAADGRARIQLLPAKPIENNEDLRRFAAAVLAAAPTATGTPVTITEAGDAVVTAFQQATLYAFTAVCIVLLVVLRSVRGTLLVIFPLLLAAIYTGAASVLLDLPFNFANVIVLPLLFGLGVASGIHLVIRARRTPDTKALMRTSTPRAVLFSALTTIASFGSLALSGHRGMTSMGQLLTIAIVFTLLCTLIVLPATMRWVERRAAG